MVFNDEQGGNVIVPVKDWGKVGNTSGEYVNIWPYPDLADSTTCPSNAPNKTDCDRTRAEMYNNLRTVIYNQTASTWTPLAETLSEAGLYFAGAEPNFGTNTSSSRAPVGLMNGTNYLSPIDYRCRSNNIIIITDGEPTHDQDGVLSNTGGYLFNETIGDADNDRTVSNPSELRDHLGNLYPDQGSDYLDDVAYYLFNKDLIRGTGNDLSGNPFGDYNPINPERILLQNVITYTIGFNINTTILQDTADNGQGLGDNLGKYFTTGSTSGEGIDLATALRRIVGDIQERNANYVTPVVPVSRSNRTYADNAVYMAFFSPSDTTPGFWRGNLKKYGLNANAVLLNKNGTVAVDTTTGRILDSSHSFWWPNNANVDEGVDVVVGGVGNVLLGQNNRQFYTNRSGAIINFSTLTATDLGLTLDTEKDDLISYLTATGIYSPAGTDARYKRSWVLGDILHSRPAVLYHFPDPNQPTDLGENVIFAGSNDGFLH
jgi:type IV pilus assembly protein PilY1